MVFVESTKIDEFEKKCIIAIFLDVYKEYKINAYHEDYHFDVDNQDGKVIDIFLFDSPKDFTGNCLVYQLQPKTDKNDSVIHLKLSDDFDYEYRECIINSFKYIQNNFWIKNWEYKYPQLFNSTAPKAPNGTSKLYKYKMNPDECEYLKRDDGTIIDDRTVVCKSLIDKKQWFQEFIDGIHTFMNPSMFNDPFDCDCDITDSDSFALQIFAALNGRYPIATITKAINKLGYNDLNMQELSEDNEKISKLLNEVCLIRSNEISDENPNNKRRLFIIDGDMKNQVMKYLADSKNTIRDMKEDVRVLCLSPYNSDILMWGYYGNSGRGLCCEYEYNELFKDLIAEEKNAICIYGNIKYSDDDKKPKLERSTKSKFNGLWNYVVRCMFTKYNKWKHESEFRLVLIKDQFSDNVHTVQGHAQAYYLGCLNIKDPLENKYTFPNGKPRHQLKKDKVYYRLVE